MFEQGKNVLIGVFVLAAIVLVVWMVLFLHPQVGDEDQVLHVYFTNVEKIKEGTRVTLAGKPVGTVLEVREIPQARQQPVDKSGNIYLFDVIIGIDSGVRVFNTDKIVISMTGLFGERNIEIVPVRPPPGEPSHLVSKGEILYAKSTDQMRDAFGELSSLSSMVGTTFSKFDDLLDQNSQNIYDAIVSFKGAMDELGITFSDVNQTELIHTLKKTTEEIAAIASNIRYHLEELEQEHFWTNLSSFVENLNEASGSFRVVAKNVESGKGTIGQLLSNDDAYLELMSFIKKGDTLMNDINHYGVLFHNNRDWKRHRAQRANQLGKLSSPQQFEQYFDCELDQISTALARVSMVVEKAECECPTARLMDNPCFVESMCCLLKKVKHLEDRLDLFNQQMVEAEYQSPCCPRPICPTTVPYQTQPAVEKIEIEVVDKEDITFAYAEDLVSEEGDSFAQVFDQETTVATIQPQKSSIKSKFRGWLGKFRKSPASAQ